MLEKLCKQVYTGLARYAGADKSGCESTERRSEMHKLIIDLSDEVSLLVADDVAQLFLHGEDGVRSEIDNCTASALSIAMMLSGAIAVEYGIVPLDVDEDGVQFDVPTFSALDNCTLSFYHNYVLMSTPHITVVIKL